MKKITARKNKDRIIAFREEDEAIVLAETYQKAGYEVEVTEMPYGENRVSNNE